MGNNILIYVEASWSLSTVDVFYNIICSGREDNFRDRFLLLLRDTKPTYNTQNCVGIQYGILDFVILLALKNDPIKKDTSYFLPRQELTTGLKRPNSLPA